MDILRVKEMKWRVLAIVSVVVLALSFISIIFMGIEALFIIAPFSVVTWTFGVIYFVQYFPLIGNLRWLNQIEKANVADDIQDENRLSKKSKVYCGNFALVCTNPCVVIPYSEIAWIYIYKQTMYGVITTQQSTIIYCKNGKKFTISATPEEAKWLLAQYIIPQSPDVVIGFGAEQKKEYLSRNPQAMQKSKRAKAVWGIVLLVLGALMGVACVVNHPVEIPAYILTAAALVGGIILLMIGKRK
jgi:hypothetical protein